MDKKTMPVERSTGGQSGQETNSENKSGNARQEFFVAAVSMSWQLAIVVLAPILIGVKLDSHFHSAPMWTIVGFVVALGGACIIVWRQLQLFSPSVSPKVKAKGHHS